MMKPEHRKFCDIVNKLVKEFNVPSNIIDELQDSVIELCYLSAREGKAESEESKV